MKEMNTTIKRAYLPRDHCQLLFKSKKTAGILMAVPFVVCFALFGIFNLIGGTVLTTMACKPKYSEHTIVFIQQLIQDQSKNPDSYLDPMKVVGIILLITGSLLVILGILLGVVACKSINFDQTRSSSSKRKLSWASISGGHQLSSTNGRFTSIAVMTTIGSFSGSSKTKSKQNLNSPSFRETSMTLLPSVQTVVDIHKSEDDGITSTNGEPSGLVEKSSQNSNSCRTSPETDFPSVRILSKKNCTVSWASSVIALPFLQNSENTNNVEQSNLDPP